MRGSEQTIEELVMSSARTYLYGHALAWDVPRRSRPSRASHRSAPRGRLGRVRAAGRSAFGLRRVPAEAGQCA